MTSKCDFFVFQAGERSLLHCTVHIILRPNVQYRGSLSGLPILVPEVHQTLMKWTEIFTEQSQSPGTSFPPGVTPRVLRRHVLPCKTLSPHPLNSHPLALCRAFFTPSQNLATFSPDNTLYAKDCTVSWLCITREGGLKGARYLILI